MMATYIFLITKYIFIINNYIQYINDMLFTLVYSKYIVLLLVYIIPYYNIVYTVHSMH